MHSSDFEKQSVPWKTKAELHSALDAKQVCCQPAVCAPVLLGLQVAMPALMHAQIQACRLDPHSHTDAKLYT